jgi:hypothetical protein
MRILGRVAIVVILSHHPAEARELFAVAKAGVSSYGSLYFGPLGGGGGDTHWKSGPIVSVGVRLRASDGFAIDGLVEYSTHRWYWMWDPITNNPTNTVVDFCAMGRSAFRIIGPCYFSFLYGLGLSYQIKEEFVRVYDGKTYATPSNHDLTGCLILGVALEIRAPSGVEISLEGNLHGRRYVTPVVELGIAYSL